MSTPQESLECLKHSAKVLRQKRQMIINEMNLEGVNPDNSQYLKLITEILMHANILIDETERVNG